MAGGVGGESQLLMRSEYTVFMFGIIKEEIKFLKVKVNLIISAKCSSVCFVPQYLGDGLVDLCKLKARLTYITSIRSIMVTYKEIMSQKKNP